MIRPAGAVVALLLGLACNQPTLPPLPPPQQPPPDSFIVPVPSPAGALARPYWPVALDSLAVGHTTHTHVAVTGVVSYTRLEDDGDLHIKLVSPSGRFVIAECIPALPCMRPALGVTVTVYGISRRDPEHGWWEVHPVERTDP